MKSIREISAKKNITALVRVDFNVPLKGNRILDTKRIDASFLSIRTLHKKKVRTILLSHIGDEQQSLRPVATYLSKYFKTVFITESVLHTEKIKKLISQTSRDTVVLLENSRVYEGEKKNDPVFSKSLASLADIYVNDAFSASHRAHASIVGVPKYLPSYAGKQFEKEMKELESVRKSTKHPFLFILGGAKFETKIPLLRFFIKRADQVVVSGALLNSFLKTAGFEIGKSVCEDGFEKEIKQFLRSEKLLLPIDVCILRGGKSECVPINEVEKNDIIVDIGPQTTVLISEKIKKSKTIVWNGPTGWYERGFTKATEDLARAILLSKGKSVIGGGDTATVVEKIVGEGKRNVFVSTAGGAMIDFLAKGTLVGVKYLGK